MLRDVDGKHTRFSQDENMYFGFNNWLKIKKEICKKIAIVCGCVWCCHKSESVCTEGWVAGRAGGRGGGRGALDPQEARWHPRPDVIFWQSKPVISGITLYSWLRPHGHIYSRRCNSRWESLQRNSDSSLKSCRNICRGYLITNGSFWFLGRRQRASPLNFRTNFLTVLPSQIYLGSQNSICICNAIK